MALYLSLAFLVFCVRLPVWSAYIAVLQRSTLVRTFMLEHDERQHVPYNSAFIQARPRPEADLDFRLSKAYQLTTQAKYEQARLAYLKVIDRAETLIEEDGEAGYYDMTLAQALNNLAWLQSTCAESRFIEPRQAVEYARRAVRLKPETGTYWNTLGVAHYRAGNFDEATEALERSMSMRAHGNGDAYDWFFLAMIEVKKGHREAGRRWYDRAVEWVHKCSRAMKNSTGSRSRPRNLLGSRSPNRPKRRRGRHQVAYPKDFLRKRIHHAAPRPRNQL